jgi:hypothetical protein
VEWLKMEGPEFKPWYHKKKKKKENMKTELNPTTSVTPINTNRMNSLIKRKGIIINRKVFK